MSPQTPAVMPQMQSQQRQQQQPTPPSSYFKTEAEPEPHILLLRLPEGDQVDVSKSSGDLTAADLLEQLPSAARAVLDGRIDPARQIVRMPYIDTEDPIQRGVATRYLRDQFRSGEWFTVSGLHVAYAVPGNFDAVIDPRLKNIIGRFSNLPVALADRFDSIKQLQSEPALQEVERAIGLGSYRDRGIAGEGTKIVVVDTRMDPRFFDSELIARAWDHELRPLSESTRANHASMVSVVARWAAPEAKLSSCPALATSTGLEANLQRIQEGLAKILWSSSPQQHPVVVLNSWAVRSFAGDQPAGDAGSYRYSPLHSLTEFVRILADARDIDFVFASGNCGAGNPNRGCDAPIPGEGQIGGVNASDAVTTVSPCDLTHSVPAYASRGPGTLKRRKPDLVCPSDYSIADIAVRGSSGAAPLLAGVLANLRGIVGRNFSARALRLLVSNATRSSRGTPRHSLDSGWGLLDAGAALDSVTARIKESS